jgi:Fe2+ or Zn2+ uptake regulation protein
MPKSDHQGLATGWLNCLLENGYRLTSSRKAVIKTIASSNHVLSPLEVYEKARTLNPKIGLVTVYRTIDKLEELGLLQRVHQPSGCHGFIAGFTGHQHLLICKHCGLVEYFGGDEEKLNPLMADVEMKSGYRIEDHWLQLFGVCNNCQIKPGKNIN